MRAWLSALASAKPQVKAPAEAPLSVTRFRRAGSWDGQPGSRKRARRTMADLRRQARVSRNTTLRFSQVSFWGSWLLCSYRGPHVAPASPLKINRPDSTPTARKVQAAWTEVEDGSRLSETRSLLFRAP
jgi:hypothetical protein